MDVEVIHAAARFYALGTECTTEAGYLVEHYRAGHVDDHAYDEISLLTSAALQAARHGDDLVAFGADENELDAADIVAEEITRLIAAVKPWRVLLDNIHRVHRKSA